MESMGRKKPRPRRSFTPEFKAEIVGLCRHGDRSVGQVGRDFDPDRDRGAGVGQAGGAGRGYSRRWRLDQRGAAGVDRAARGVPQAPRGCGDPQAGDGFLRDGDPVNVYPFTEAERAGSGNASRACALLMVSRAAFYYHLSGPSQRDQEDAEITEEITAVHKDSKGRYGAARPQAGGPEHGLIEPRHLAGSDLPAGVLQEPAQAPGGAGGDARHRPG
jgi:hypothetical protein